MSKFLCGECIHNNDKGGGCLIPRNLGYVDNCNRYLPKDRPIVQTNEEWIKSLNTEQLARWIAEEKMCRGYFIFPSMEEAIQDALEWLKEVHK